MGGTEVHDSPLTKLLMSQEYQLEGKDPRQRAEPHVPRPSVPVPLATARSWKRHQHQALAGASRGTRTDSPPPEHKRHVAARDPC